MKNIKDLLTFTAMLLVAMIEILLLMFHESFENTQIVNLILVVLPVSFIAIFFYSNRKYHLRHIYSDEELEKQNRK